MKRDLLSDYLANLLAVDTCPDSAPNGLQVAGRSTIKRLCTAVTASQEAIQQAVDFQADALLVHHGLFWKGDAAPIVGMKRERLRALLVNDINLFAYHLPLDAHATLGNNAMLAQYLGAEDVQQHAVPHYPPILWSGKLATAYTAEAMLAHLSAFLENPVQVIKGSTKQIRRLAWCSGGAQDFIETAAALGVDAYISGEVSERTFHQARELGIYYFAGGHHATERFGIRALGEHVAERFGVELHSLDSSNPF